MENITDKEVKKNPLLEKVQIPGEKFRMPSGGIFYKKGELEENIENGEVYVHPMNAMDELTLKSPDKLLSGEAVIEVFKRCIPEVTIPSELLAKDVDYLLMCLRMVSYGPNIELSFKHACEDAKDHSYSFPIRPILQATKPIDPTTVKNFRVETSNGQVVALHPPKYLPTIKLYQVFSNDSQFDTEVLGEQLIENVASMIETVDDYNDAKHILEWLKTIRVGDVQTIGDKITELSDWGLEQEQTVSCKDCGEEIEISVPVNPIAFFT